MALDQRTGHPEPEPLRLKICKLHPDAVVPQYATEGAACFDLHAIEGGEVPPYGSTHFATGLAVEVPTGYALMIYSRSGHGFNRSVRLVNGTGVVDSDYRGEVLVKLRNDGPLRFDVEPGERIAQAMLIPVPRVQFEVVEQLSLTERGSGGFGSTGN